MTFLAQSGHAMIRPLFRNHKRLGGHAYACTAMHVFMHIGMHAPSDTKPQHVKTMNVLDKCSTYQPSHRYCAPRETSKDTVWVTKRKYALLCLT